MIITIHLFHNKVVVVDKGGKKREYRLKEFFDVGEKIYHSEKAFLHYGQDKIVKEKLGLPNAKVVLTYKDPDDDGEEGVFVGRQSLSYDDDGDEISIIDPVTKKYGKKSVLNKKPTDGINSDYRLNYEDRLDLYKRVKRKTNLSSDTVNFVLDEVGEDAEEVFKWLNDKTEMETFLYRLGKEIKEYDEIKLKYGYDNDPSMAEKKMAYKELSRMIRRKNIEENYKGEDIFDDEKDYNDDDRPVYRETPLTLKERFLVNIKNRMKRETGLSDITIQTVIDHVDDLDYDSDLDYERNIVYFFNDKMDVLDFANSLEKDKDNLIDYVNDGAKLSDIEELMRDYEIAIDELKDYAKTLTTVDYEKFDDEEIDYKPITESKKRIIIKRS